MSEHVRRARLRLPLPRPATVFAYHGVNDEPGDDPHCLVLAPHLFRKQVALLARAGFRFLSAEAILDEAKGERPRAGTAVLTFDDGWQDAQTIVAPLLAEFGATASFYVCPGWLGGQHPDVAGPGGRLLDAARVRELSEAGFEIGSHSMAHRDLRSLSDRELRDDLRRAKGAIEDLTGRACRTLAYPYGLFDDRVEAAVAEAGHELALAWMPGPWRRFAVPRLAAPPRHGARRLALKLAGIRRRRR